MAIRGHGVHLLIDAGQKHGKQVGLALVQLMQWQHRRNSFPNRGYEPVDLAVRVYTHSQPKTLSSSKREITQPSKQTRTAAMRSRACYWQTCDMSGDMRRICSRDRVPEAEVLVPQVRSASVVARVGSSSKRWMGRIGKSCSIAQVSGAERKTVTQPNDTLSFKVHDIYPCDTSSINMMQPSLPSICHLYGGSGSYAERCRAILSN